MEGQNTKRETKLSGNKRGILASLMSAIFGMGKKVNNSKKTFNHTLNSNITYRYGCRSTQSKRRKLERRTGTY